MKQTTTVYIFYILFFLEISKLILLGSPIGGLSFKQILFAYEHFDNFSDLIVFYSYNIVYVLAYPFLIFSNNKFFKYLLLSYLYLYTIAIYLVFMEVWMYYREPGEIIKNDLYEFILYCFYIVSYLSLFFMILIKELFQEKRKK